MAILPSLTVRHLIPPLSLENDKAPLYVVYRGFAKCSEFLKEVAIFHVQPSLYVFSENKVLSNGVTRAIFTLNNSVCTRKVSWHRPWCQMKSLIAIFCMIMRCKPTCRYSFWWECVPPKFSFDTVKLELIQCFPVNDLRRYICRSFDRWLLDVTWLNDATFVKSKFYSFDVEHFHLWKSFYEMILNQAMNSSTFSLVWNKYLQFWFFFLETMFETIHFFAYWNWLKVFID